ncbi:peptidase G2 [Bacillus atrophaeus]|uniref:peptidase G2 autoproteolytic cleavage domain-containing protein n=1 Tax=Bacillus atrophaeus TaxID=1452 RepID=UPI001EFB08B0|nr:peptidase G2 autoproteolytic cleavage domain-containing protein [Bacillus atrophaeus]MCG8395692.1 peptidase G2 [Bacillus atrophaeus]
MVYLNKRHEVTPNGNLFNILDDNARLTELGINQSLNALNVHKKAKTAHQSNQIEHHGFNLENRFDSLYNKVWNLITEADGTNIKELIAARIALDSTIHETLDGRLDYDFNITNKRIDRVVNIDDFGAVPDGVTDSTEAIQKALGEGNVYVTASAGIYVVREIRLPSNVKFIGQGEDITIFKLHDDAPASTILMTNNAHANGNMNIYVDGFTLDWNKDRQGGLRATGGINSSCFTLANVKFARVKNVKSINAGLHGFDITAPTYDHDATIEPNYTEQGCKYVWIDNCRASNYGDDGITTHYSEFIFIDNSHCSNPSGEAHNKGISNSNGIEVDDGSKNVWIDGCHTEGNIRGVEIKAHKQWPAPQNVHVSNHVSYNDVRSYDLRHIDHHRADEPWSDTARDVALINCTAIKPMFNDLYKGLSPRALVVSAYQRVKIIGFTAIGDPEYNYENNAMISFQYKSRKITLDDLQMHGFKKANCDIHVTGGDQKTDDINITNVDIHDSSPVGIALGGGVYNVNLTNVLLHTSGGTAGITSPNTQANLLNVRAIGYNDAAILGGEKYSVVPNNIKGGFRTASSSGHPLDKTSAIIATTGGCKTKGPRNAVIASSGGSSTEASRQAVIASNNSHTKGDGSSRMVLASQGVENNNSYSIRGGYGTGKASTSNTKWEIDSQNGNILGVGRVESASNFKDYAEYFESVDGKRIDSGYLVTLEGDKIRKALKDDEILGVISETAGVVLGSAEFYWNNKYLRNDFGGLVYEETEVEYTDKDGNRKTEMKSLPKPNPNYNPELAYTSRQERDEWHIVGLIGQVHVRIDDTVQVGDKITAKYGKGTKSEDNTGLKVMKIKQPYDSKKGYGVAIAFIR